MACNHWQQVFCMTAHLKYTPEQQLEAAKKVGGSLLPIYPFIYSSSFLPVNFSVNITCNFVRILSITI